MNTKMNASVYTGSGHRSVIPCIQCGWVSALLILVSSIEELIIGRLQARECLWEEVVLQIGRVLLWWKIFFWTRELPCKAWTIFYRRMERGYISSPDLSGSLYRTWVLLVRRVLPSLFHPRIVYLKIFFVPYPPVTSLRWDSPGCWLEDKYGGITWQILQWSIFMSHDIVDWFSLNVVHRPIPL
jgi:hypothetical protein